MQRRRVIAACAAWPFAHGLQDALAQAAPDKTLLIIVPFGPGGAADSLPRLVGTKLAELWGDRKSVV